LTYLKISVMPRMAGLTQKSFFILCIYERECRAMRVVD